MTQTVHDQRIGSQRDTSVAQLVEREVQRRIAFTQLIEPLAPGSDSYLVPRAPQEPASRCAQGLPVPPVHLMLGYGTDADSYLQSGATHVAAMEAILAAGGFSWDEARSALEFGCGAGRMIRWLKPRAGRVELWGVDVGAERVLWARRHLSPPFRFALTTIVPHLPFEDRRFDLVWAGSVFTHLDDLADAWLLELKRVLMPGGRLYITVHDRHTLRWLEHHPEYWLTQQLRQAVAERPDLDFTDFGMITVGRSTLSQVFYDDDYLRALVERDYRVVSVTPEAYGYQTAMLLEPR
jgi:SAM-dependent methyltransferase